MPDSSLASCQLSLHNQDDSHHHAAGGGRALERDFEDE